MPMPSDSVLSTTRTLQLIYLYSFFPCRVAFNRISNVSAKDSVCETNVGGLNKIEKGKSSQGWRVEVD